MDTLSREGSRRIRMANLVWPPSLGLWLLPPIVLATTLFLTEKTAGSGWIESETVAILLVIAMVVSLLTTISYAVWSQMLQICGVRHAILYAVAGWVVSRVIFWMPLPLFEHVYMDVYDMERLGVFGGENGMVTVAVLALLGAIASIICAFFDLHRILRWGSLALAAPFVTMIMFLQSTTSWLITVADDTCILLILGFAIFWRFKTVGRKSESISQDQRHHQTSNRISKLPSVAGVVGISILTSAAFNLLLNSITAHNELVRLSLIWLSNAGVFLAILMIARLISDEASWNIKFASVVCLIFFAIGSFPGIEYIDTTQEELYFTIVAVSTNIELFSPMGILVMSSALILSLTIVNLNVMQSMMIGGIFPALFLFTLAKPKLLEPPDQLDLIFWAEPTLLLIAAFALFIGVFSPTMSLRQRSLDVDSLASR